MDFILIIKMPTANLTQPSTTSTQMEMHRIFFRGPSTISNNPNFDYNSNNDSNQLGTTITPGGFLLNRFTADDPSNCWNAN